MKWCRFCKKGHDRPEDCRRVKRWGIGILERGNLKPWESGLGRKKQRRRLPQKTKNNIRRRAGNRCELCGSLFTKENKPEIDHIVMVAGTVVRMRRRTCRRCVSHAIR